jgi:hypothetical protein
MFKIIPWAPEHIHSYEINKKIKGLLSLDCVKVGYVLFLISYALQCEFEACIE